MGWLGRLFGTNKDTTKTAPDARQAFTELVATEAAQHPLVARVEPAFDEEFTLRLHNAEGDSAWTLHLSNLFLETRECSPEERRERVRSVLRGLDDGKADLSWEQVKDSLVPLVRLRSFASNAPVQLLSRPFLPFVPMFVGIDRRETIMVAHENHLRDWQQNLDDVFTLALANLQAHLVEDEVEPYDPTAPYPIWHVAREDSYESSRLALPGYLAAFRDRVEGNPIAIIPHRSALIITGDARPEAVERLAQIAEAEFAASPRALSPAVYTLGPDAGVEPLRVPDDHPLCARLGRGQRILAANCYAEQKQVLDADFAREEQDIFVATLGCLEKPEGGQLTTWASMARDVDALLPEADVVALSWTDGGETQHVTVPWQALRTHAPECLERDERYDPPRWRVRGWPSDETLEILRDAEVW